MELHDSLPADVQSIIDRVVDACGGTSKSGAAASLARYSDCSIDLPTIWKRLQLNQMGSYSHPEHIGGAYQRTWRFFTGTGEIDTCT